MMPFISSEQFENCRLPEYLAPYGDLITHCVKHEKERNSSSAGKVFYLSIEESEVELGFPQRQPGLHVDRPRSVNIASSEVSLAIAAKVFQYIYSLSLKCHRDKFLLHLHLHLHLHLIGAVSIYL